MSKVSVQPVSGFSPYYGCAIMLAAMGIFAGIVTWSVYTLLKQDAELDKITVDTPAEFPKLELDEATRSALAEKWLALEAAATPGAAPAEIELSVAELNAVIALAPDLGNGTYTDVIRVTGTDPEAGGLLADISLPINRLPFQKGDKRHLVGRAVFTVEVHSEGPDVRITSIEVPGREVPAGMVESQHLWTWVAPYRKDEKVASVLKAVRRARVTPQGLTLSTAP